MNTLPVLSVRRLSKKIRKKWIVKDVSFDLHAGEIFGFLGPNGAGKTTTIRMLVQLIRPTAGEIWICGHHVERAFVQAMRHVGSIVENPELYPYLTGWENLEHFAAMIPGVDQQRIYEVVEKVGMDERIHDKVNTYSLGMKQRLGIAQALLGKPRLLILDEPTNGLDPQGIKELRAFVRELADDGMSILISSHLLTEIQLMCDRVAVIRSGEIIGEGDVAALLQQAESEVMWRVANPALALRTIQESGLAQSWSPDESEDDLTTQLINLETQSITVNMDHALVPKLNQLLTQAGVPVYSVQAKKKTLEDLFLELTGGGQIE